jgi:endo-1,4-beta-xylanase
MKRSKLGGALCAACMAFAAASPAALAAEGAKVPAPGTLADFEDGTTQGWHNRGDRDTAVLAVDATRHHEGAASLRISSRSATWNGPQRALAPTLAIGETYHVSAWIYYDEGPARASFTASVELGWSDPAIEHQYKNVATVKAAKGAWTRIEFDYLVPSDAKLALAELYFETTWKPEASATPDDFVPFNIDDIAVAKVDSSMKVAAQEDIPSLYEALSAYFPVGTAVSPELLDRANPHYRLLQRQYSALVAGNAMKPESLQPKEGEFRFDDADRIALFASRTGKLLRGHTLVWHQQTPPWFFADPADPSKPASRELLLSRLDAHVKAVVEHFKGDVYAWDVVNEVLAEDGRLRGGAELSKWGQIAGPDYIERAFRDARAADPKALLFINDYNLESSAAKREGMYALVKGLRARGVPVDGVGLQMHVSLYGPSVDEIRKTIELFASLGVKVEVTELDVSLYRGEEPAVPATDALLRDQGARYGELFALFKDEAKKGRLDMVVLWGSADDDTWLDNFPVAGRPNAPLLFDRKLQAKPAFWAIVGPPAK